MNRKIREEIKSLLIEKNEAFEYQLKSAQVADKANRVHAARVEDYKKNLMNLEAAKSKLQAAARWAAAANADLEMGKEELKVAREALEDARCDADFE